MCVLFACGDSRGWVRRYLPPRASVWERATAACALDGSACSGGGKGADLDSLAKDIWWDDALGAVRTQHRIGLENGTGGRQFELHPC